jgi:hypothetical protein
VAEQHWLLWTGRNGARNWDGPFESAALAWVKKELLPNARNAHVVSGTELANAVPSAPAPASEFASAATDPRSAGFGPWFTATYDSGCAGPCGGKIYEGDEIRADGEGGWLCSVCGDPATWPRE